MPRVLAEVLVARQLERTGADPLLLGAQRRQRLAVAVGLRRFEQLLPREHDAAIRRAQILARAILDRAHALLQRCILHGDSLDAGKCLSGFLSVSIN